MRQAQRRRRRGGQNGETFSAKLTTPALRASPSSARMGIRHRNCEQQYLVIYPDSNEISVLVTRIAHLRRL